MSDTRQRRLTVALSRRSRILSALLALVTASACAHQPAAAPAPRTLVLVSLDGFRSDYFDRLPTPNLHRLASRGVRAERMVPSFPSKTFPNHYTLVTGRYPEHHGIVANDMRDPDMPGPDMRHPEGEAWFSMDDRSAVRDGRWWQAEPLWITAERQGIRTAPVFWPGSEAVIGGIRPTWSMAFDSSVTAGERVLRLLDLLGPPAAERPRFLTLYLQDTDDAGHEFGPESPELAVAVGAADEALGELLTGLERLGLASSTDVVVVADHGMASTPLGRVIYIDDLIDLNRARVVTWSPVLELWPAPEEVDALVAALSGAHPHLTVYRREELPARLHYDDNDRIPPIIALADEGWRISTHKRMAGRDQPLGEHGYDPALPSMGALFVAAGPSFRCGVVVPPFENVEVYPLLCAALGIEPLPGDWSAEALPAVLRAPSQTRSAGHH